MSDQRLQQAHDLYQQGQLNEALRIYRELLDEQPDDVELLHFAAALYAQTGDLDAASTAIDKAIALAPNNAMLFNSKGNICKQNDDLDSALSAYRHALELNEQYAVAYNNLANCLQQQGQLEAAHKNYLRAIELDDDYVDAHYNYGVLLAKLGDYDNAIVQLNKTLRLNSRFTAAHGQLAELYLQQQDFEHAIEHFEYRLTLQPNHAGAYHGLGQALLQSGNADGAIEAMQQALSLDDQQAELYQHLGNAHIISGDEEKALNYFMRQLELDPLPECYYNIGVLLAQKNRHKEAIEYLEQAAKEEPGYLPTHLNLGALYLKLNATNKAIAAYQAAAKVKPDDKEIQHIISALQQSDTPERAPESYVQHLFDQYATYYDKHLLDVLNYQVPKKIFDAIDAETQGADVHWQILDLGCGTGLCGKLFKPLASEIIGIDISAEMIENAKQKNIYDELYVEDAETALMQHSDNDLILAADVFTYIGKLDTIFAKVKAALKPGGLFAFSVEKTFTDPYILQQTIRYAHAKAYLERLIAENEFDVVCFDNLVLRENKREQIEGYLIVLRA